MDGSLPLEPVDATAFTKPAGRKLVKLLDLTPESCRWPFGNPKDKDFGFCGCKHQDGSPYCAEHTRKAHSAVRTKRAQREALDS